MADLADSFLADGAARPAARRIIAFYLATCFGIAWAAWFLCWLTANGTITLPLTPTVIIGSFGPFFAAGLCATMTGGWRGAMRFYGRALQWRMGWGVLLTALLLLPAICLASAALYARQHSQHLELQMPLGQLPMAYLWLLILGGPVGEEFGWSYLSDNLDTLLPVKTATLLLGVVWAVWHLPLFLLTIPGLTQHYMPFAAFLLMSVAGRFIFSWAYHRGGLSILSNLLFHNSLNLGLSIVTIVPQVAGDDHLRLYYFIAGCAGAAFILWRLWPPVISLSEGHGNKS